MDSIPGWTDLVYNNNLTDVKIESTADSNNNMPVAFDIVFVSDKELLKVLAELSAPQWFQNKAALHLKHSRQITLLSAEVVPLTLATKSLELPDNSRQAAGILLFANYLAPAGQMAAYLQNYSRVKVLFSHDNYQLISDGS